ncbi:GAF and ANTAR domain-containing protein [Phycicoccus sp. M110.8]|uniref:GAF and ANTAR domain-containing protein n=1 Tax=Phycicoccus sp. M110.8 TaxID=3075433 RepID=UPI0028FDB4E8|nr:GAF and ANTAR domain-containing protein [Phycicoccus sp. M110.8]MDU0313201.1 GAF and ANTAR domain-containing protein [Phycicoccus sp. M110.8]
MATDNGLTAPGFEIEADLSEMCLDCVDKAGVDGVGLAVFANDGTPGTVHATNELAARIEDLQFTTGEGPCVDAARTGYPVLVPSLSATHQERWPAMARELTTAGVRAIFALPIRVGAVSFGSLDLHRLEPGPLSTRQMTETLRTVDRASELLLSAAGEHLEELLPATTYRMVVHQAVGMVMVQLDVGVEDAMLRLRAAAYAEGQSITELAADIVARRRRLAEEGS